MQNSDDEHSEFFINDDMANEIITCDSDEINDSVSDFNEQTSDINVINPSVIISNVKGAICCVDICLQHDPPIVATGAMDDMINIYELFSGICINNIKAHNETVTSVNFHQKSILLSADLSGLVLIWQLDNWITPVYRIETDSLQWAKWFDRTSLVVIFGMSDGCIQIWKPETMQYRTFGKSTDSREYHVPYVKFGRADDWKIAFGDVSGNINIFGLNTQKLLHVFSYIKYGGISELYLSENEHLLFALFEDTPLIIVVNLVGFSEICVLNNHLHFSDILVVAVGNAHEKSSGNKGLICIWDLPKQRLIHDIEFLENIEHALFLRDNRICCSFDSGKISIIELPSETILGVIYQCQSTIDFLKYFRNDKLLISHNSDSLVNIYQLN
ncbi:hypothetical protein HZS_5082 [Henneguya salminicola]|nr:hypothetical protein HZS_5082 [Henneguya salminicola]